MKTCLSFLVLATFCTFVGKAQDLLEHSRPYIKTFDRIDSEVLSKHIAQVADSARIIGLGEVSHYTKECYTLKHEILKTLIQKEYDALVLEVDFGQALLWNDYVTQGKGNLDSLIAKSGWFTYRTLEFKELLRDIRNHNLSASKPFQVFGMEMTAMNHNLTWLATYIKTAEITDNDIIDRLQEDRKIVAFQKHGPDEVQAYWSLYYDIKTLLETQKSTLVKNSGEGDYAIALRITELLRQYATYIAQDDFYLQVEFRDQFSTRNVNWVLEQLGAQSKIAIWAHNGHVVKKSVLFNYDVLGHYLNKWFGDAYYAIGFTFNEGEFGAFSNNGFKRWQLPKLKTPSLTTAFNGYNSPFLYFDVRGNLKLKQAKDKAPFDQAVTIRRDISESYQKGAAESMTLDLTNAYDCLIYIDRTHYPTTIDWAN